MSFHFLLWQAETRPKNQPSPSRLASKWNIETRQLTYLDLMCSDHIAPDSSLLVFLLFLSLLQFTHQLFKCSSGHPTRYFCSSSTGPHALRHPWMRNMLDESDAIGHHRPGVQAAMSRGWSAAICHGCPVARSKCWSFFYHFFIFFIKSNILLWPSGLQRPPQMPLMSDKEHSLQMRPASRRVIGSA